MAEHFKIAIIGSGPGGLSAAARAAELQVSHVLLEASAQISNTIFRYQKGKHVMAEPDALPLRSPLKFAAGTREAILQSWNEDSERLKVNLRYQHEVSKIEATNPGFRITCANKQVITADFCVLGVGLQGNLRTVGVEGEELPFVQYQLDDPDEYSGETIIVIGAGDAAIENAIALAADNQVIIINRKDEFARAKDGNLKGITRAIDDGSIECYFNSAPERIESLPVGRKPGRMWLSTPKGRAQILCDRVIARLGANPPRQFVEACGVQFPSKDPAAVPALSSSYESNVKGLYIVGALGGFPLIKAAMNQGYEVVETIMGRKVDPADQPLLEAKFKTLPGYQSVEASLKQVQANAPHLAAITPLQLREFMIDSNILAFAPGQAIFKKNDYTNSFFSIVGGTAEVLISDDGSKRVTLQPGEFFGEMGLISGRRRSATVVASAKGVVLIETPRRSMLKLISSVAAVKQNIDRVFIERALRGRFDEASPEQLREVAASSKLQKFAAGDVLFSEGDEGDCLHLVRTGSLTISRHLGGKDVVLAYVPAGQYVGEMALLGESKRTATARAAIATETIRVEKAPFEKLLQRNMVLRGRIQQEYKARAAQNLSIQAAGASSDVISFLIGQGAGEATDILLIDESLCVRCDNCEKACAETHGGTSRLDREAGPTFANVHVPTSCRHCEHPHCMKDCPPDAIHRSPNGEVFIADNCIGCGNCERNCPYGVIHMAAKPKKKPGLLSWLFFGLGSGPGESPKDPEATGKKAVKCDMCKSIKGGAACVRACPTGAAIRISPEQLPQYALDRN